MFKRGAIQEAWESPAPRRRALSARNWLVSVAGDSGYPPFFSRRVNWRSPSSQGGRVISGDWIVRRIE